MPAKPSFGAEYLEMMEAYGGKTLLTLAERIENLRLLDCLYYSDGSASCLNDYNGY